MRFPRTWRHLRRYRQIIAILVKYGFTDIVEEARAGLVARFGEKFIPAARRSFIHLTHQERIRIAVEDLGPTFIKLGQVLSLRPDIIPPDISAELSKLQDQVSPLPFSQMEKILCSELATDPSQVFRQIETAPLAAASIAQVHRAYLPNGQPVVLKIQRPGIQSLIETDLQILHDLAFILHDYIEAKYAQDPLAIVAEFDQSIHRELDFLKEGHHIQRFKTYFADDPTIRVPNYYAEYSTSRLLVMDYIEGIKASQIELLDAAGINRQIVARNGTNLSFRQIFELGFFHADPHPGNILVLPGNVIALLDYGMVGQIDEASIDCLGDIVIGILNKDIQRLLRALENLTGRDLLSDNVSLRLDINNLVNSYAGVPLKNLHLEALLRDFFEVVRRYRLSLPSHLTLMLKALLTVEGLARILYPEFDVMSELQPWIKKIIRRRYDPRRLYRQGFYLLSDLEALALELPRKLRAILNKASEGNFAIQFQHRNLEHLIAQIKRTSNHLAMALIIAALIVASAILIQANVGKKIFGYSSIGAIGYLIACLLGIKLLWDIFHDRK